MRNFSFKINYLIKGFLKADYLVVTKIIVLNKYEKSLVDISARLFLLLSYENSKNAKTGRINL